MELWSIAAQAGQTVAPILVLFVVDCYACLESQTRMFTFPLQVVVKQATRKGDREGALWDIAWNLSLLCRHLANVVYPRSTVCDDCLCVIEQATRKGEQEGLRGLTWDASFLRRHLADVVSPRSIPMHCPRLRPPPTSLYILGEI